MRVKTITYAMLRKTLQYENDKAEVTVEINEGENLDAAIAFAKATCEAALKQTTPEQAATAAKKTKVEKVKKAAQSSGGFIGHGMAERIVDALEEA